MYSKSRSRAPKGEIGIQARGNGIQFNLPTNWFPDSDKRVRFLMGLPNMPENWAQAEKIAKDMKRDFLLGALPDTVEGIKRKYLPKSHLTVVESIKTKSLSTLELWDRYQEYQAPKRKETTRIKMSYWRKHVEEFQGVDCLEAIEVRNKLLELTTNHQVKRVLIELNAACNWAIKHDLISAIKSPYEGMASELPKYGYQEETKPNAFLPEEKETVLEAFRNHKGTWNGRGFAGFGYCHYTHFVEFLFLTGCRPSEAVGLQWKHVSENFGSIRFEGSISSVGKRNRVEGSKNNKKREFPCSSRLSELLRSIKPENVQSEQLVFPAPKGGSINYNNFCNNAWNRVVDPINPDTTPYSCRDTFITMQILKGVPETVIAKWCDTSVEMIQKHYADFLKMQAIRPID